MKPEEHGASRNARRGRAHPFVPFAESFDDCTGSGSLDESERRLSHEELRVALAFVAEGHAVRSLAERPGRGRCADLEVCGKPVEVKSWLSLKDRQGVTPGSRSVVNKLTSAEGQSPFVVLVANGSGLSATDARSGVARYAATHPTSSITTVRVMGDGFDLAWQRSAGLAARRAQRSEPHLGVGV